MTQPEWPAWPFLLGAVLLAGLGFWQVAQGTVLGWVFVAGALLLLAVAIRQGRRALTTSGEPEAAEAPVAGATQTKEGTGLSAYYENEEAVRAMQKESRRLCKECGSPVLEKASECPTCGSRV